MRIVPREAYAPLEAVARRRCDRDPRDWPTWRPRWSVNAAIWSDDDDLARLRGGVRADDREALVAALDRWATTGVAFVDAWLTTVAIRRRLPVCSPNVAHFAEVRNTFPMA